MTTDITIECDMVPSGIADMTTHSCVWSWCDIAPVLTTVYIDTTANEINASSSDGNMQEFRLR